MSTKQFNRHGFAVIKPATGASAEVFNQIKSDDEIRHQEQYRKTLDLRDNYEVSFEQEIVEHTRQRLATRRFW